MLYRVENPTVEEVLPNRWMPRQSDNQSTKKLSALLDQVMMTCDRKETELILKAGIKKIPEEIIINPPKTTVRPFYQLWGDEKFFTVVRIFEGHMDVHLKEDTQYLLLNAYHARYTSEITNKNVKVGDLILAHIEPPDPRSSIESEKRFHVIRPVDHFQNTEMFKEYFENYTERLYNKYIADALKEMKEAFLYEQREICEAAKGNVTNLRKEMYVLKGKYKSILAEFCCSTEIENWVSIKQEQIRQQKKKINWNSLRCFYYTNSAEPQAPLFVHCTDWTWNCNTFENVIAKRNYFDSRWKQFNTHQFETVQRSDEHLAKEASHYITARKILCDKDRLIPTIYEFIRDDRYFTHRFAYDFIFRDEETLRRTWGEDNLGKIAVVISQETIYYGSQHGWLKYNSSSTALYTPIQIFWLRYAYTVALSFKESFQWDTHKLVKIKETCSMEAKRPPNARYERCYMASKNNVRDPTLDVYFEDEDARRKRFEDNLSHRDCIDKTEGTAKIFQIKKSDIIFYRPEQRAMCTKESKKNQTI